MASSGGNAGLAVAWAARALGARATVVVPSSTPPSARAAIESFGATARVHGAGGAHSRQGARASPLRAFSVCVLCLQSTPRPTAWHVSSRRSVLSVCLPLNLLAGVSSAAGSKLTGAHTHIELLIPNTFAWENNEPILMQAEGCEYFSAYDDPELWAGHASLVEELAQQLAQPVGAAAERASEQVDAVRPSAVVVSVGGGGLLCGVAEGMGRVGWGSVPLVAAETVGAECFHLAQAAGEPVEMYPTRCAKHCGFPALQTHTRTRTHRAHTETQRHSALRAHKVAEAAIINGCLCSLAIAKTKQLGQVARGLHCDGRGVDRVLAAYDTLGT